MLKIWIKDSLVKEVSAGTTLVEIAKDLGINLVKDVGCGAKVNGVVCDLRKPLTEDSKIEFLGFESAEGKKIYRSIKIAI